MVGGGSKTLDGMSTAGDWSGAIAATQPQRQGGKKVGRNQPCPCGSGKKYKLCHGATAPRPA